MLFSLSEDLFCSCSVSPSFLCPVLFLCLLSASSTSRPAYLPACLCLIFSLFTPFHPFTFALEICTCPHPRYVCVCLQNMLVEGDGTSPHQPPFHYSTIMFIAYYISKISYELQSDWAVLCRMKDSSEAVLEGPVFSCMEGEQGHKGGGRKTWPCSCPSQDWHWGDPWPWGTLFVMGSAKDSWTPLTCPPSQPAWRWEFMGCRVEHLGTVCDLQDVSGWGRNPKWERRGIKIFLGGTSMENKRNKS